MKKGALLNLLLFSVLFISCGKKNIQPVISLEGDIEQTLSLGTAYVESGATAKDNKDGDITSDIVISGTVNHNKVGDYRMFYNVQDSEGNKAATATRYIKVVNDADFMIGTYEASPTCTGTSTYEDYNTLIWASDKINNQIFIRRILYTVEDEPVVASISGDAISIPLQTIGEYSISGSATIVSDNFLLDVEIIGPGTYDCTINHIKL